MRKVRVLVVDDSVVVRRMLSDILSSDPAIEVVGTAATGAFALVKIPQICPDVITLDVEMPDMNGLEVLAEIRKSYRSLAVIMFSSMTENAAAITLQALSLGATDYVTKPSQLGSLESAQQHVREQLLPKIKAICAAESPQVPLSRQTRGSLPPLSPATVRPVGPAPVGVLAVGASTGGPNALTTLFGGMAGLPVPVVIVQHMPPLFTKLLAERLSASCAFPFHEAKDGDRLEAGHAWIAPGDHHMRVVRDRTGGARIALDQGPPENSCRPAVDVLFRSIAASYGAAVLAVVLTGMGQDGLRGCEHVREQAGQILVQDQATSVVWGMPGIVARAGLAQAILPLPELGVELLRRITRQRQAAGRSA